MTIKFKATCGCGKVFTTGATVTLSEAFTAAIKHAEETKHCVMLSGELRSRTKVIYTEGERGTRPRSTTPSRKVFRP